MPKKITLATIVIIILVLATASFYFYRKNTPPTPMPISMSMPVPTDHKTDNSNAVDGCSKEGVYIDAPVDFDSVKCCPGLVKVPVNGPVDENCKPIIPDNSPGYEPGSVCLACGDGVCNDKFENKCNCAEDCK
jgi:hypothetical protein